ncbi:hypothetical protein HY483_04030 [Candidatus Woesearchaeota archaeon]|nr:hypothetical protein [Candidatus Woesearchaeota archaeon]
MMSINDLRKEEEDILSEFSKSRRVLSDIFRERIRVHIQSLRSELIDRIDAISGIADSKSAWKQKGNTIERLKKERLQLVSLLEGWEKKGF